MTDEELANELRDMGCPFTAFDNRARTWLAGYQAGHKRAQELAIASLDRIVGEETGKLTQ